jgi:biotin carboxyl carrier protein
MKYVTTIGEKEYVVEVLDESHVVLDGQAVTVDFDSIGESPVYSMLVDGKSYEAFVYSTPEGMQVMLYGRLFEVLVEDERERRLRGRAGGAAIDHGEFQLKAPMPGLVVAIPVGEGQEIHKGDVLVVLESMKMQNELKAPRDGIVGRVRILPGERVEQRQLLLSVI